MSARNSVASCISLVAIVIALPVTLVLGALIRLHSWGVEPVRALWKSGT